MSESKPEKKLKIFSIWIWILMCLGGLGILAAIAGPTILAHKLIEMFPEANANTNPTIGQLGTAGDFLGGTMGPFLSAASVFFLIATILIQRSELKLQREELAETKNIFKFQSFDSTFFHMINLHNQIVESIYFNEREGRDYFEAAFGQLNYWIEDNNHKIDDVDNEIFPTEGYYELNLIIEGYGLFYKDHQTHIGHYFRNLYHIIKLVDENPDLKTKQEKLKYIRIIRAQLSSFELVMLLYNALYIAKQDKTDFIKYINEFEILQNMDKELLIRKGHMNLLQYFDELRPMLSKELEEQFRKSRH